MEFKHNDAEIKGALLKWLPTWKDHYHCVHQREVGQDVDAHEKDLS